MATFVIDSFFSLFIGPENDCKQLAFLHSILMAILNLGLYKSFLICSGGTIKQSKAQARKKQEGTSLNESCTNKLTSHGFNYVSLRP